MLGYEYPRPQSIVMSPPGKSNQGWKLQEEPYSPQAYEYRPICISVKQRRKKNQDNHEGGKGPFIQWQPLLYYSTNTLYFVPFFLLIPCFERIGHLFRPGDLGFYGVCLVIDMQSRRARRRKERKRRGTRIRYPIQTFFCFPCLSLPGQISFPLIRR